MSIDHHERRLTDARKEHERRVEEARQVWHEARRVAEAARTRANIATHAVGVYQRENAVRLDLMHEGVNRAVALAGRRLEPAVWDAAGRLCNEAAEVDVSE